MFFAGKFLYADVKDYRALEAIVVDNRVDWIIHLSALLSFAAEKNPQAAIDLNNIGTLVGNSFAGATLFISCNKSCI